MRLNWKKLSSVLASCILAVSVMLTPVYAQSAAQDTEEKTEETAEEKTEEKAEEEDKEEAEEQEEAKADEKAEEKADEKAEEKADETAEEKADEKAEEKADEKAEEKTDEKAEEKTDEKAEEKAEEQTEEKTEEVPAEKPAAGTQTAQAVMTEEAMREAISQSLREGISGYTDQIIAFSDEQLEQFKTVEDEFTNSVGLSWGMAKAELGEKLEDQSKAGEVTVDYKDGIYTVVHPVAFEKEKADFIYTFDESTFQTRGIIPSSLNVDVKYSMATNMTRAGLNTIMGLATVFIMLVFLSFIISLFKLIPDGSKKKKEEPAPAPAPVREIVPAQEEETEILTDDTELVAVIAAAIAAAEGTAPDGFVVRSIRKARRAR